MCSFPNGRDGALKCGVTLPLLTDTPAPFACSPLLFWKRKIGWRKRKERSFVIHGTCTNLINRRPIGHGVFMPHPPAGMLYVFLYRSRSIRLENPLDLLPSPVIKNLGDNRGCVALRVHARKIIGPQCGLEKSGDRHTKNACK